MTAKEFEVFWASTYPETIPISHYFKHDYAERWFRIHSLPEAKRYADSEHERQILLDRQNTILTDLLGRNGNVLFVTGEAHSEGYVERHPLAEVKSLQDLTFTSLGPVDLHKLSPEQYEAGHVFKPMFSEQVWQRHGFDGLLMDIANDELRAFFISVENCCLVAPYDGGIDVVVKDQQTKKGFENKYREWPSQRKDGL